MAAPHHSDELELPAGPAPGYCEDYPCCGHEAGDCFGQLYGSDEAIKQAVYDAYDRGEWD